MSMMDSINWGVGVRVFTNDITYRFVPGGVNITGPTGTYPTVTWSTYEKAQFRAAFKIYETFLNVKFTEDFTPGGGIFKLASIFKSDPSDLGALGPPGEPAAGIGEFNFNGQGWHYNQPGKGGLQKGGLGFQTIIHEIGHGLGLAHPHDDGGGTSPIFPGVNKPFGALGAFKHNQNVYTMMSYNKGWASGPLASRPDPNFKYGNVGTPMAFDIGLLQLKYGANNNFNKGNNTYTLPDKNAVGTYWSSIWDTGGNDTLKYNGAKDAVIDLRAATLKHAEGGGGYLSNAKGVAGGFTIANKVVIENAVGGSGHDKITGNATHNKLDGRAGNDTLKGGSGNDTLIGGAGKDTVTGDAGNDTLNGGAGNDKLYGAAGNDKLNGAAGNDTLNGGPGNDILTGGLGKDIFTGGTGKDRFDFNSIKESVKGSNRDQIKDFRHGQGDKIDLRDIDANTKKGGNQNFKFIGDKAFSKTAGELRFKNDIVQGDVNGDGKADFEIKVVGDNPVKADFIL